MSQHPNNDQYFHFLLRHLRHGTVQSRMDWEGLANRLLPNLTTRDHILSKLTEGDRKTWANLLLAIAEHPNLKNEGYLESFHRISPFQTLSILCLDNTQVTGNLWEFIAALGKNPDCFIHGEGKYTFLAINKAQPSHAANESQPELPLTLPAPDTRPRC